MPLRTVIVALALFAACGTAAAADLIGYSEAFDTLYRVNLTSQTATEVGRATPLSSSTRIANIVGLTFSPAGKLYAASDANSVKSLLQIDPETGLATVIGTLNLGSNSQLDLGMAFTCDGRLWLSAKSGQLWRVNPSNAAVTLIGNLGATITGLAARGNTLFGAGSQGNNNLYRIDTAAGHATLVGSYGTAADITVASPGFDAAGQLWTILDYVPPLSGSTIADWSDLASVNPETGALSNLGPILPTGTSAEASYQDLFQVGLKGLAIPNAVCADDPVSTPILSRWAIFTFTLLLVLVAGTRLYPRRQNA